VRAGACLFHLPNKNASEIKNFFSFVERQIEDKASGEPNFVGFVFPPRFQICERSFPKTANFRKAVFEGDVTFEHVRFDFGAIFDEANFAGALIVKDTSFGTAPLPKSTTFTKAQFGQVTLENVVFYGYVQFNECNFAEEVMFDHTTFVQNSNFQACTFSGKACFENVRFVRDVAFSPFDYRSTQFAKYTTFAQTTFNGNAAFDKVSFLGETNFDGTEFSGYASFDHAKFLSRSSFFGARFDSQVHFNETGFRIAEFIQTTFGDVASFKAPVTKEISSTMLIFHFTRFEKPRQVSFLAIPFVSLSFLRTDVSETLIVPPKSGVLTTGILDEELLAVSKGHDSSSDRNDDLGRAAEILRPSLMEETVLYEYKNLRKSLESNRLFNEAAELFVLEMRMARRRSGFSFEFVASWLYDKISLFGESIKRPILLTLAVTLGTALYFDIGNNLPRPWTLQNIALNAPTLIQEFSPILSDVLTVFFQMRDFSHTEYLTGAPVWAEIVLRISSIVLLGNLFVAVKRRLERK
jgi:uncharacterized protein YjbI with pentapeptide repeats